MDEAQRQQHQIRLDGKGAVGDFRHGLSAMVVAPLQSSDLHRGHLTILADKLFGGHRPVPFAAFLV